MLHGRPTERKAFDEGLLRSGQKLHILDQIGTAKRMVRPRTKTAGKQNMAPYHE